MMMPRTLRPYLERFSIWFYRNDGGDLESSWSELLEEPHSRVVLIGGALCALCLVDRQGRQKLIIGSYLGLAISMVLVVYAISFPIDEGLRGNLSILWTVLYMLAFAIGAGPITGLIIPELSSSRTHLLSIMENGHSDAPLGLRNPWRWHSLLLILLYSFMDGYHFSSL